VDEAVRVPRQGHDGRDRSERRGGADARRGDHEGLEGAGRVAGRAPRAPADQRGPREGDRRLGREPADAPARRQDHRVRGRRVMAEDAKKADVLVIFGITGDLARVMTFRSLYRLEARELLDCPIVGVAFDDWTLEQLIERARDSIVATGEPLDEKIFERFSKRFSYIHRGFKDPPLYQQAPGEIKAQ